MAYLNQDTLKNNAYFAHPENILLAMVNDAREEIRERAWFQILDLRRATNQIKRTFKQVNIQIDADNYTEIID